MPDPRPPRRRQATTAPLSFAQERLWFVDVAETPGGSSYNVPLLLPWRGRADVSALAAALGAVVARHEALRTVYRVVEGAPTQVVTPPRPVEVTVLAASAPPTAAEVATSARIPFDLTVDQPVRCVLWRAPEGDTVLLTFHHIAVDGWSLAPLFDDLTAAYGDAVAGREPALADAPLQYPDFAHWERESGVALRGIAERAAQLAGADAELRLAGVRPGGDVPDGARPGGEHRFVVPAPLWTALTRLATRLRATPFVVLFAAYQEVLRRWSGSADFLVGSIMANRVHSAYEGVVGFFANTVPLRCQPQAALSFEQLCRQSRVEVYRALSAQSIPLHHLAAQVATIRGTGRAPLVTVGFTMQNMPAADPASTPWHRPRLLPAGTARFDLMMITEEVDGELAGSVEFDLERYPSSLVAAFVEGFLTLLEAAVRDPAAQLAALPLTACGAAETVPNVLVGRSDPVDVPALLEPVAARLAEAPAAPAVTAGATTLSRGALDRWAWTVARRLAPADPGSPVPVLAARGGGLVAGWLGVLRSGAAYVALGLETPPRRLRAILADAGARVVVADAEGAAVLSEVDLPLTVVRLDGPAEDDSSGAKPSPAAAVEADQPAVLFYTSGTTGTPKGVLVPHRGLANSALWWARDADLRPTDRVLCAVGSAFDPCSFETFRCLTAGAELVFADDLERRDGRALLRLISGCTVAAMTPSLLTAVLDAADDATGPPSPPALRLLYLGGEVLTRSLVTRIARRWPAVEVRNVYGPTEASCNATCAPVDPDDGDEPAIGRPIANTRAYVTGPAGEELPRGAVGELRLAGPGVALGYLGRPAETEAAFPPDPVVPGGRMYRTGDLVSVRADGQLAFHGRVDDQVKVLGNRIELGEVRRRLEQHPQIVAAAVEAAGQPARLTAYVVLAAGAAPTREAVVRPLAQWLPPAALPVEVRAVESLPLTANGKVDFGALRAGPGGSLAGRPTRPLSPAQAWAADRFSETLGLSSAARAQLGPDSDFFGLGGHSLLAVQMLSRVDVSLRQFLADPTVAGLARARAYDGARAVPALAASDAAHPATPVQEAFYLLDRIPTLRPAYLAPSVLELRDDVDVAALRLAVDTVLARHPALRSRFTLDPGSRRVVYHTDAAAATCTVLDGAGWNAGDRERFLTEQCWSPVDLRGGPPARAVIVTAGGGPPLLVLTLHHIAADGWSHGVLLREISECYRAERAGVAPRLRPAVHPAELVDDWAARTPHQRAADLAQVVDRLAGMPTDIALPHDRPRAGLQRTEGAVCAVTVPVETSRALKEALAASGCTLPMAAAALVAVALARRSDQRRFLFAYPWAGRDGAQPAAAVAMLVNTGVLGVDVGRAGTWRQLLEQVRTECLASYQATHVPFETVAAALAPERDLSRPRLTPVLLAAPGTVDEHLDDPFRGELDVPSPRVKYELEFTFAERGGQVSVRLAYACARFDRDTVESLLASVVAAAADLAHSFDGSTLEALQ